ncbi:TPA: nitrate ABC transporter ATP-binding protein [Candidatus Sumerlaeota bacterium]|jgi:ABC-type nitrate/sulfonate/bicarbonate transport system ATPase subunit|nr:nitrate ABC transporter ATP-binding protein [Candidatus Sumerlaeota bacterium]
METKLNPLVQCHAVSLAFHGKTILQPFDLAIFPSDVLALHGPSGAGKTTLLRLLAGLLKPTHGTIEHAPGIRIGIAFQTPRLLPWRMAWQNVAIPLMNNGDTLSVAENKARKILTELELSDAADSWPGSLSGGMAQRVSLARALAIQPDLLLLDEPLNGLDDAAKRRTLDVIRFHAAKRNMAILHVTHNAWETEIYANRFLRCENGIIEEINAPVTQSH